MKPLRFAIICAALVTSVTVPWLVYRHAAVELHENEESVKQKALFLDVLSAENERLSRVLAVTKSTESISNGDIGELLKLRNEITQLRTTRREMDQLQESVRRLQDRLQDAAAEEESGPEIATILLADEMPLRRSRLARLNRWLEGMPQEKIPELRFVSEDKWIQMVDRPLVTDEDYRSAMARLRSHAESNEFVPMLFMALKQYFHANNDGFPADVSQLKPYFEIPIDDAILQRYEIVPAKSLIKYLAEAGEDWVITQKAPVNREKDGRFAVGTTTFRGTIQEGRWDTVR